MLIQKVIIQNYRNFENFSVELTKFNAILGENNIGKTNFLRAINFILNPNLTYRRIFLDDSDFIDINKPIKVKISFNNITSIDEALFSEYITIDPDTNEKSLIIEYRAIWNKKLNENENECKIIREDLPEDDNSREIDFYYNLKKGIPFLFIPTERIAEREISFTKKSDFRRIFDFCAPNFLSNLSQLKISIEADINSFIDKINETEVLNSFLDDVKGFLKNFKLMKINLNDIKHKELEDIIKLNKEIKNQSQELFDLIDDEFVELNDSEKNIYSDLIDQILDKLKIYHFRYERQIELIVMKEKINDFPDFNKLNELFENLLKILFSDKQFNISFIPVQDEAYLRKASVIVDSFPLLKHGDGMQSTFVIALKIIRSITMLEKENIQNLIVAIEEPESHCHPQLQRTLIKNIKQLQISLKEKSINLQIIITTHSSNVVRCLNPQEIILFRKRKGYTFSLYISEDFLKDVIDKEAKKKKWDNNLKKKNMIKISKYLWNMIQYYPEAFFSKCVILGEGDTEEGFFTTFPLRIGFDLDENNLTFINIEGKYNAFLHALLFQNFKISCIGVLDIDQQSISEFTKLGNNFIPTNLKDFEAEILNSYPIYKLLECIKFLSPESSIKNRLIELKKFNLFKNSKNFDDIIKILKNKSLNDQNFIKLIKKWLDSLKGLGLGRCLGEKVESIDEISTPYIEAIKKAIDISKRA